MSLYDADLLPKMMCKFNCHEYACVHMHTHTHTQYKETMMKHLTVLVNEKGLDSQNYHCAGCTRPIGISKLSLPRVCACTSIQENDDGCEVEKS